MQASTSPAPAWFQPGDSGDALATEHCAALQGLRLLGMLRVFTPVAQALTLLVVINEYEVQVPLKWVVGLLVVEALLAIATWVRLRAAPRVSSRELFLQVHVDILLFTLILYFTGGASNPFAPLFLLPIAIATSALAPHRVWLITCSTMAAYTLLRHWHLPMVHPHGLTEVYDLHEDGMVVNYLFTALLAAFFGTRMSVAMRRHERMLADARDAQMRNESVVAIGALAAGYAHELSSPLATMAVVVSELQRGRTDDPELVRNLQVVDDQIKACKQIISSLANAAGHRRAESVNGARLDQFVENIIERAHALHPGATVALKLDEKTPPPMVVAEETLRQAITNLIDNAVQASPHQVEVSADWSQGELLVEVRDHGTGYTPQALERLGRQVGTTKAGRGGLGVGLLLSAATLERLGGRLELSNAPDGGARARLRLPLHSILIKKK